MDEIKIFKLITGQDIVCFVNKYEDNYVYVKSPIMLVPNQENGLAAIPWILVGDDKNVKVNLSCILAEIEPDVNIKNFYNEKFGSGITVVQNVPSNVQPIK